MAAEVFISYTQADREAAEHLCSSLEAKGIACWIAPRNVAPGSEWAGAIVEAIRAAKALVLILSANSKSSRQLAREVENADEKGLKILTFRIEDVAPPDNLGYYLGNIQWIDAFGDGFDAAVERLTDAIKNAPAGLPKQSRVAAPALPAAKPLGKKPWVLATIGLAILLIVGVGIAFLRRAPETAPAKASRKATELLEKARQEWKDGNKTGAMNDVSAAISDSPQFAAPYLFRARLEDASGDQKAALTDVTACIDREPKTDNLISAYRERVKLRQSLGDAEGAKADQEQIRKLQNQNR